MAFAPDLRTFSSGRNFAAWLGLVPRQQSTSGKQRLVRRLRSGLIPKPVPAFGKHALSVDLA